MRVDVILALTLLTATPSTASPQGPVETGELAPSPLPSNAAYGEAVDLSGNTAVVGESSSSAPATYVFVRSGSTWTQQAVLPAGAGHLAQTAPHAVAVSGDTIATGEYWEDNGGGVDAGAVYVFVRAGTVWSQQAQLLASDASPGKSFGLSAAVDGQTLVVGAPGDTVQGKSNAGSAYVFTRAGTTWTERKKLIASTPLQGANFGSAVDIEGDFIVVGAEREGTASQGAAYVFSGGGALWTQQAHLPGPPPLAWLFGACASLSGDRLIVGSPAPMSAGSAYIFVRSGTTWSLEDSLPGSPGSLAELGTDVAIWGDTALVGARHDASFGSAAGAAYLFTRSGSVWTSSAAFSAAENTPFDRFGTAVALESSHLLVGAHTANGGGAAYSFVTGAPTAYCTAGTSASGCSALLSASGTPSATAPSGFDLLAAGVEGAKNGMFFFGTNGPQANPWGNSGSYQCVVPPLKRAGLLSPSGSAGQCDGSFAQDLNALWCPTCPKPVANPGVGTLVQAQLWYRDPQSTGNQTTSLSDAIEFAVLP